MENFNLFWLTNVHPYIYQRGHELMIGSDAIMSVFIQLLFSLLYLQVAKYTRATYQTSLMRARADCKVFIQKEYFRTKYMKFRSFTSANDLVYVKIPAALQRSIKKPEDLCILCYFNIITQLFIPSASHFLVNKSTWFAPTFGLWTALQPIFVAAFPEASIVALKQTSGNA